MKRKGVAKGRLIELESPLPEGTKVEVEVAAVRQKGTSIRLLLEAAGVLTPDDAAELRKAVKALEREDF